MNNINKSNLSKHCENWNDLKNSTAAPIIPSTSILTQVRNCKVVLEDISLSCGAAKLQTLGHIPDETHTTDSHHTTESNFLKNLCLKTPIAWGNSTDERWTELDDKVSIKLHMCTTLAETVALLQETIYTEAWAFLGISNIKQDNLPDKAKKLNCPFNLSNRKTCF